MTAATKVSTCVGCGVALLGERLRCPACHDRHASGIVAPYVPDAPLAGAADDDATAPKPWLDEYIARDIDALTRLGVAIEVIVIVVLALVLLVKGCP